MPSRPTTMAKQQLRQFGLLVGTLFPLLFSLLLPLLHRQALPLWPLVVGLVLIALGLLAPQVLRQPYRLWMALGHGLGWINGHLILGLIYIVVLQPIALCMRLLGHDPLRRHLKPEASSYREPCTNKTVNLERPF